MPNIVARFPRSIIILFVLLLITVTFSVGFFVGTERSSRYNVPDGEGQVLGRGDIPTFVGDDVEFQQYWDVWNFVKEEFYRQPVSDKDLFYGSMKGLLAGLNDPYSVYFEPVEAEEFEASLEGSFEGIGAEIGIRDEKLQIVAPLSDSPAENAGLLPGDWIVLIDGTETLGMSVEEAVTLIRGEKGTEVVLSVSRNGLDTLIDVPIIRDKIVIDSARWEIDENNFMVIGITTFNHETAELFNEAVQEALASGVDGMILDLRSNPGGLLSAAIDVAAAWVGYDTVVIERTREGAKTFQGLMAPRLEGLPTVVLVNGGSASGSEIVAGALQDYGYAELVGTQTFGKGSVQDYRELGDGSSLKITTAEWFTPNGRTINETGIEPDADIEFSLEEYEAGIDPQLNAAKEILLGIYEWPEETTEETSEETDEESDEEVDSELE